MTVPLKRKTTRPIYIVTAHRLKLAPLAIPNGREKENNSSSNTNGKGGGTDPLARHAFSYSQD